MSDRRLDDLDPIDLGIVRLLQQQGRTSNARIARELGISEPTARKRIDRLVGDGILKVVAVLNPAGVGYATDVIIGIRVEPGRAIEVGEALARMDEVVYLGYTTGRYDLIVETLFRDDDALFAFLTDRLPALGGIVATETASVLRTGKINYDWKLPGELAARARSGAGDAPAGCEGDAVSSSFATPRPSSPTRAQRPR